MYAESYAYWDESDTQFETAGQYDERGDQLQLVMLLMALGLTFAAWASLLKDESNLRPMFGLFSVIMFVIGLVTYLAVPVVVG